MGTSGLSNIIVIDQQVSSAGSPTTFQVRDLTTAAGEVQVLWPDGPSGTGVFTLNDGLAYVKPGKSKWQKSSKRSPMPEECASNEFRLAIGAFTGVRVIFLVLPLNYALDQSAGGAVAAGRFKSHEGRIAAYVAPNSAETEIRWHLIRLPNGQSVDEEVRSLNQRAAVLRSAAEAVPPVSASATPEGAANEPDANAVPASAPQSVPPVPPPAATEGAPKERDADAIPVWQQVTAAIALVWVLVIVTWLIIKNPQLTSLNQVLVRTLMSMACATWAAMIPATFQIKAFYRQPDGTRLVIHAIGAAAFFAATFWSTPEIFPETFAAEFNKPEIKLVSVDQNLTKQTADSQDHEDILLAAQVQTWKDWAKFGFPQFEPSAQFLVVRAEPFDRDYLPFCARLELQAPPADDPHPERYRNDVVELRPAGCAYLLSRYDRVARQLDYVVKLDKENKNPTNDNLTRIDGADKTLRLVIVVAIAPREEFKNDFQINWYCDKNRWKLVKVDCPERAIKTVQKSQPTTMRQSQ